MRKRYMSDCAYFTYLWTTRDKVNINQIGINRIFGDFIMAFEKSEERTITFKKAYMSVAEYLNIKSESK